MAKRGTIRQSVKGGHSSKPKGIPENTKIFLQSIKTTGDVTELLAEAGIPRVNIDELLDDIMEEEFGELEDTVTSDLPDEDDLREEHEDLEDDYIDFDEPHHDDPFDVEDRKSNSHAIYVAKAYFDSGESPNIVFSQIPICQTDSELFNNALRERLNTMHEMAAFIAKEQKDYFIEKNKDKLKNLNQQDLIDFLNRKGHKLDKGHASKMLDFLYFGIDDIGAIPAKSLFKRHSGGLARDEKHDLTLEFLRQHSGKNMTLLAKAKELINFIQTKKGISIKLSDSENEHDRYKQWKTIISQVEKENKK